MPVLSSPSSRGSRHNPRAHKDQRLGAAAASQQGSPADGAIPLRVEPVAAPADLEQLFQLTLTDPLLAKLYPLAEDAKKLQFRYYWQKLSQCQPLVPAAEVMKLRAELTEVHNNNGQLIHLGDCVEDLAECTEEQMTFKLRELHSLRDLIRTKLNVPTVAIARMAGQLAKPRSQFFEPDQKEHIHTFMGEMINGPKLAKASRTPHLERLLEAQQAAHLGMKAMAAFALDNQRIYASHEALHLLYEGAQTRPLPAHGFACQEPLVNHSCHFPWIGMRSVVAKSHHLRYIRGLVNPIGIKIGPSTSAAAIEEALDHGNPGKEKGKLVFITRLGAAKAKSSLAAHIATVDRLGGLDQVLWLIDPMHGNTRKNRHGLKFRALADILAEIEQTLEVHRAHGTTNSGLHLEASPTDIIECSSSVGEGDTIALGPKYRTLCDPRLNWSQTMTVVRHYLDLI